jgi:malonyl-CoA O-methyltransferase
MVDRPPTGRHASGSAGGEGAAQDAFHLDRRRVAASFDRASGSYDRAARLQQLVRDELAQRLRELAPRPRRILDLGCGTGEATVALRRHFRGAQVTGLDLAPSMVLATRRRSRFWRPLSAVVADTQALPFAAASFDVVFSSLMLQWCEQPDRAFAEIHRVLAPDGVLLFSTFGPGTLAELRAAWAAVDDAVHVNRFIDMHDLGAALQRAGFREPVLDVDRHRLHYADVRGLMRELKAIGAHNVNAGRPRGLTGRHRLAAMEADYETLRAPAGLPATYEVVYGTAWSAGGGGNGGARVGVAPEAAVPLDSLRARLRGGRR